MSFFAPARCSTSTLNLFVYLVFIASSHPCGCEAPGGHTRLAVVITCDALAILSGGTFFIIVVLARGRCGVLTHAFSGHTSLLWCPHIFLVAMFGIRGIHPFFWCSLTPSWVQPKISGAARNGRQQNFQNLPAERPGWCMHVCHQGIELMTWCLQDKFHKVPLFFGLFHWSLNEYFFFLLTL